MRLNGSFYTIIECSGTAADYRLRIELAREHMIYEGHFPERAVVPGVCTMTMVRECAAQLLGREVIFSSVKECKFVSALLPEQDREIVVCLSIKEDGDLRAEVRSAERVVMKLRAQIKDL